MFPGKLVQRACFYCGCFDNGGVLDPDCGGKYPKRRFKRQGLCEIDRIENVQMAHNSIH